MKRLSIWVVVSACSLFLLLVPGCVLLQEAAFSSLADGVGGVDVFLSEEDPELVREALPFTLKTVETLLRKNPENEALLKAAAGGFLLYASAFIADDAFRLENTDPDGAAKMRTRAGRLALRARDYAWTLSSIQIKGFEPDAVRTKDFPLILQRAGDADADALFLLGSAWAFAISMNPSDMNLVAELPIVESVMRRVLELSPAYGDGAIQEFFMRFEAARPGGSIVKAREHFEAACQFSKGAAASPYVAMASSIAVKEQDSKAFDELLAKALEVDPELAPDKRLFNVLAQRHARALMERKEEFFLEP